jgi:hypothetical protein
VRRAAKTNPPRNMRAGSVLMKSSVGLAALGISAAMPRIILGGMRASTWIKSPDK